jgi:aspartate racemase
MKELRTLGLLGGLSWHSTMQYYHHINTTVEQELGEYRSAPLMIHSVDFGPIVKWQLAREWDRAGEFLAQRASGLEVGGAEAILICSNTMHKVASYVTEKVKAPLLHIATGIARELKRRDEHRATLIGTRYTMKDRFLYEALRKEGVEAAPPSPEHGRAINKAIYKRLVFGTIVEEDQSLLNEIVRDARQSGFGSVILGCTEIAMLINEETPQEGVLDSTLAHSELASDFVLGRV